MSDQGVIAMIGRAGVTIAVKL
eukprot:COSAG03_NODE_23287_length_281_cov_0.851648_1_plen_21_part_01